MEERALISNLGMKESPKLKKTQVDSVVEEGDEVRTQSGDVVQGNGGGAIWVESKDVVTKE